MPGHYIRHLKHFALSILNPILEMKKLTKIPSNIPSFTANKWKSWNLNVRTLTPEFLFSSLHLRLGRFSLPQLCSILGLTHAHHVHKTLSAVVGKSQDCSVTKLAQKKHIFHLELATLIGHGYKIPLERLVLVSRSIVPDERSFIPHQSDAWNLISGIPSVIGLQRA